MILFAGDYVIVDQNKSPDVYENWQLVVDTRAEEVVIFDGKKYPADEGAIFGALSAPEFLDKFNSY